MLSYADIILRATLLANQAGSCADGSVIKSRIKKERNVKKVSERAWKRANAKLRREGLISNGIVTTQGFEHLRARNILPEGEMIGRHVKTVHTMEPKGFVESKVYRLGRYEDHHDGYSIFDVLSKDRTMLTWRPHTPPEQMYFDDADGLGVAEIKTLQSSEVGVTGGVYVTSIDGAYNIRVEKEGGGTPTWWNILEGILEWANTYRADDPRIHGDTVVSDLYVVGTYRGDPVVELQLES